MYRIAIEKFIKWKESKRRKPLIIEGARQVGKTWLMKEFGKLYYADTVYINFDSNSRMAELFASDLDTDRLIMGLELYAGRKIDPDNTLLIFDEVATGFGRTGNRFVADLVQPDILVLGKALTGGYIGHAVTVASKKVFKGFYDENPEHAFMHGPTFMGNALACSVALKSIEIFESQNYMQKIKRIEEITRREMENFSDPRINEVRIMGGCVCIEVKDEATLKGYQQFAYERGVFSRPFLKYLYAMVPYIISEEELIKVLDTMKAWFV